MGLGEAIKKCRKIHARKLCSQWKKSQQCYFCFNMEVYDGRCPGSGDFLLPTMGGPGHKWLWCWPEAFACLIIRSTDLLGGTAYIFGSDHGPWLQLVQLGIEFETLNVRYLWLLVWPQYPTMDYLQSLSLAPHALGLLGSPLQVRASFTIFVHKIVIHMISTVTCCRQFSCFLSTEQSVRTKKLIILAWMLQIEDG